MRKRKIKTLSKSQADAVRGMHYIGCDKCGGDVLVGKDVGVVICDWCVQLMVPPPQITTVKPKSDKPRGWHFKKYFEHDGIVYSLGEEVTDKTLIAQLKKEQKDVKKVVRKTKTKASTRGRKHARTSK